MSIDRLIDKLTEAEKQRLAEAKSPEELDALPAGEGLELSDDALGAVAGGCFRPVISDNSDNSCYVTAPCPNCGELVLRDPSDDSCLCPACKQPLPVISAEPGNKYYDHRVL